MHFPTDRTDFGGPVVDNWYEWKIAQMANASAMQALSDDPNLYRWVLYRLSYVSPMSQVGTHPDTDRILGVARTQISNNQLTNLNIYTKHLALWTAILKLAQAIIARSCKSGFKVPVRGHTPIFQCHYLST